MLAKKRQVSCSLVSAFGGKGDDEKIGRGFCNPRDTRRKPSTELLNGGIEVQEVSKKYERGGI